MSKTKGGQAQLKLTASQAAELKFAMDQLRKFDGDVVSKADHDLEVAALKAEVERHKRMVVKLVLGQIGDRTKAPPSTIFVSCAEYLSTAPIEAFSIYTAYPPMFSRHSTVQIVVEVDPAYDPKFLGAKSPWIINEVAGFDLPF